MGEARHIWEQMFIRLGSTCMNTVKIRRAGNSNAITLPRELEELGYVEGAEVMIRPLPNGALMVMPAAQVEAYIDALIAQVVTDNRDALDLLAAYDRGEREH